MKQTRKNVSREPIININRSTKIFVNLLTAIIIIIIIINDKLARSLEPVVTECKEHTIHTQTQVVASRKPKEIKRTHEGEADLTT